LAASISWQLKVKAYRALPHLVATAKAGKTITYKELGDKIGLHHRPLQYVFGYIRDDICRRHDLPMLNALVVNADTQEPGGGWLPAGFQADVDEEQARVTALGDWEAALREIGFDI
jgi:putative restriction endonuclease